MVLNTSVTQETDNTLLPNTSENHLSSTLTCPTVKNNLRQTSSERNITSEFNIADINVSVRDNKFCDNLMHIDHEVGVDQTVSDQQDIKHIILIALPYQQ